MRMFMRLTLFLKSCVIKNIKKIERHRHVILIFTERCGPWTCRKLYSEKNPRKDQTKHLNWRHSKKWIVSIRVDMSCELKLSKVASIPKSHKSKCIIFDILSNPWKNIYTIFTFFKMLRF